MKTEKLSLKSVGMRIPVDIVNQLRFNHAIDEPEDLVEYPATSDVIKHIFKVTNFEPAQKEGLTLKLEEDFISSDDPNKDAYILTRIASMDEDQHMALFQRHGLSHDGGDDFDYAGSYYNDIITIIAYAFDMRDFL